MKSDYDVGELKDRINILRAANSIDAEGNTIKEPYTSFANLWANIYSKASDVVSQTGEVIHSVRVEITIRYRTGILESDKIIDYVHGRTFEQTAPAIPTANRKWLVLTCREVIDPDGKQE